MKIIGKIAIKKDYARAGKSEQEVAKVNSLLPDMALFGHFCQNLIYSFLVVNTLPGYEPNRWQICWQKCQQTLSIMKLENPSIF